jgi:hypothetical protein
LIKCKDFRRTHCISHLSHSSTFAFSARKERFIDGTFQALTEGMNASKKITITMISLSSLATVTLSVSAGPIVTVQVPVPTVTIQVPAPAVTAAATIPDNYVWDGTEFVGVVGTQYYYLGPDKVWLPFDAVRVARFHDWERVHADWRTHAIRNELYRHDAHGHVVPLRADPGHDLSHDAHDLGHDKDHDHDY